MEYKKIMNGQRCMYINNGWLWAFLWYSLQFKFNMEFWTEMNYWIFEIEAPLKIICQENNSLSRHPLSIKSENICNIYHFSTNYLINYLYDKNLYIYLYKMYTNYWS